MPANIVKPGEEDAWERAKRAVRAQYPDIEEDNPRFYKLTTTIFQNMKALDAHAVAMLEKARPRFVVLLKAYVRSHTRKLPSGRTVTIPAFFTKRTAASDTPTRKRAPTHAPPSSKVHTGLTPEQLAHRLVRHVKEGTMSHEEAEANVAHLERRAHAGHGLEHGHGPAWEAHHLHEFVGHARSQLLQHKTEQAQKVAEEEELQRKEMEAHQQGEQERRKHWESKLHEIQQHLDAGGLIQRLTNDHAINYSKEHRDRFSADAEGVYVRQGQHKVALDLTSLRLGQFGAGQRQRERAQRTQAERRTQRARQIEAERQQERTETREQVQPKTEERPLWRQGEKVKQDTQRDFDERVRAKREQGEQKPPPKQETQQAKPQGEQDPEDIHYQQYKRLIPKIGHEAAVQRAGSALASHVLSREMGETIEAFAQRSPRYRGLRRFLDEHATHQRQAQAKPGTQGEEKPPKQEPSRTVTKDTALENTKFSQKQWPRNVRMGQLEERARQHLGDRFGGVQHHQQAWGDRIEVWSKRAMFDGSFQRRREAVYTLPWSAEQAQTYRQTTPSLVSRLAAQAQAEAQAKQEAKPQPKQEEKPPVQQQQQAEAKERRIALAVKNLRSVLGSRSVTPAMIELRIQGLERMARTGKRLWGGYSKDDVGEIAQRLRQAFPKERQQVTPGQRMSPQQEQQLRQQTRSRFEQENARRGRPVAKSRVCVVGRRARTVVCWS